MTLGPGHVFWRISKQKVSSLGSRTWGRNLSYLVRFRVADAAALLLVSPRRGNWMSLPAASRRSQLRSLLSYRASVDDAIASLVRVERAQCRLICLTPELREFYRLRLRPGEQAA
jgi:hypothetical protein